MSGDNARFPQFAPNDVASTGSSLRHSMGRIEHHEDALGALRTACSMWGDHLAEYGVERTRSLFAEFGTQTLLDDVEAAAVVWLLWALPPEEGPLGPFATRLLGASADEIAGLAARSRLTIHTATMLVWLSRGRLDQAADIAAQSYEEFTGFSSMQPEALGHVYAEFLLAVARVRLYTGRLRESSDLFEEALAFGGTEQGTFTTYRALTGQAMALALNAEFGPAGRRLDSARDIASDADFDWPQQAMEAAWCRTLILAYQDRYDELRVIAKQVRRRSTIDPVWRPLSQILDARLRLRDGHCLEAANILRNTLRSFSTPSGHPVLENSAAFLLGLALIGANQPVAALQAVGDSHGCDMRHTNGRPAIRAFAMIARGMPEAAIELTEPCIELGREHPGLPLIYVHGARAVAYEILGLTASSDYSLSTGAGIADAAGIRMEAEMFSGAGLERLWQSIQQARTGARPGVKPIRNTQSIDAATRAGVRLSQLTPKEREVLERLARPGTMAQVASDLFITENTAKTHAKNIYRKLSINSRTEAADIANAAKPPTSPAAASDGPRPVGLR